MSAAVVAFPRRLGKRAFAVSVQQFKLAAEPHVAGVLYVRQAGRLFWLSSCREDLGHEPLDVGILSLTAPTLGQGVELGHPRQNNERTWRAWAIGRLELMGFQAVFL